MNFKRSSIQELANEADLEIEEALIKLWDGGLGEVRGSKDMLVGSKLLKARKILLLPLKKDLRTPTHWQNYYGLSKEEFEILLLELNINLSDKQSKLPQGSVKKLISYLNKSNTTKSVSNQITEAPTVQELKNFEELKWESIGHEKESRKLTFEEIIAIHNVLVDDFISQADPINPPGPRDENLIQSAVYRQFTCMGEKNKYPTVEMCGAALVHSLIHNHPFHNGNKRTALVALLVYLDINDFMLICTEDELFKFVLQIAQHKIIIKTHNDFADREVLEIARWIIKNSRQIQRGERPVTLRKLKQILTRYDCLFEQAPNGKLKINRTIKKSFFSSSKTFTTSIQAYGDGREVHRDTINSIRHELNLKEENGVDSAAFYEDSPTPISSFIDKYRKILLSLGKL